MNRARVTVIVDAADVPAVLALHKSSTTVRVEPVTDDYERYAAVDEALNARECQICNRPSKSSPCAICGAVDQAIIERYYQP